MWTPWQWRWAGISIYDITASSHLEISHAVIEDASQGIDIYAPWLLPSMMIDQVTFARNGTALQMPGDLAEAVQNCLFYENTTSLEITDPAGTRHTDEPDPPGELVRYSLFYGNGADPANPNEWGYQNTFGDAPAFLAPAAGDYRLQAGSPAKDADAIAVADALIAEAENPETEALYMLEIALLLEETDGGILGKSSPEEVAQVQRRATVARSQLRQEYAGTTAGQLARVLFPSSDEAQTVDIPHQVTLAPAYPNPFNPSATIEYGLPEAGRVTLTVFDLTGRVIATLVDAQKEPGTYTVPMARRESIRRAGRQRSLFLSVPHGE